MSSLNIPVVTTAFVVVGNLVAVVVTTGAVEFGGDVSISFSVATRGVVMTVVVVGGRVSISCSVVTRGVLMTVVVMTGAVEVSGKVVRNSSEVI